MLRIALCDDSDHAICQYTNLINSIAEKHQLQIELSCFSNGEALLFQYCDAPQDVDIIYLDILMDKANGMEIARSLRGCGCTAQIIFLTDYEEYVFEAFEVKAIHYLLKKDTGPAKFEKVFLEAVQLVSKRAQELFSFEFNGTVGVIPISEIAYFEIWKRRVTVHYGKSQKADFYGSMEQLEKKLSEKNFVRTHRSFLVHLPYIAMFHSKSLLLKTGQVIPVGVTYMQSLKEEFAAYLSQFHVHRGDSLEGQEP